MAWRWLGRGGGGAVALALLLLGPALARGARAPERVPGELLVRWRPGAAPAPRTPLRLGAATARVVGSVVPGVQRLRLVGPDAGTAAALAALRRRADVVAAEPHYLRRAQTRDPYFAAQWALTALGAEAAWLAPPGDAPVTVAVIDTGGAPHPDLAGRLLPGYDFVSRLANSGDGDGRDPDPTDPEPDAATTATPAGALLHGTFTAGIIAAVADNDLAVAGVVPAVRLLPVRVLGVDGAGGDADIAAGIRWAAGLPVEGVPDNPTPARILNLSFAGPGLGFTLADAIADAVAAGALVVAAVGNDGVDGTDYAPAGLPLVVGVGATCRAGRRADYSNFGAVVDLVAPGGCLDQDTDGDGVPDGIVGLAGGAAAEAGGVQWSDGTSAAAAHASAVAALALTHAPDLTPADLAALLVRAAAPVPDCGAECGAGAVRADTAVALARACAADDPACDFRAAPPHVLTSSFPGCAAARSRAGAAPGLAVFALVVLAGARRRARGRPRRRRAAPRPRRGRPGD